MQTLQLVRDEDQALLVAQVRAAQAGDREAFGRLVVRFERMVYATAFRRLGNDAEAQELTQEVFLHAWDKLSQLRQPECAGRWLRVMTGRMAINRALRRPGDQPTERETLDAQCVTERTPLADALERERQTQVRDGLDRLGELDRDTLLAFYVQGQSLVEMSNAFASPVGTIKRRLHVARKRLARQLEELAAV